MACSSVREAAALAARPRMVARLSKRATARVGRHGDSKRFNILGSTATSGQSNRPQDLAGIELLLQAAAGNLSTGNAARPRRLLLDHQKITGVEGQPSAQGRELH